MSDSNRVTAEVLPKTGAERRAMLSAIAIGCVGAFVLSADTGLVSIALPRIQADLEIPGGDASWVNNAFTLALGSFLIMFGRLADRIGTRRVFVTGCVLCALAALGCGFAESSELLFAARALQGFAGAMLLASGLGAILEVTRAADDRVLGMAAWGMANASSIAVGFVVGGLVSDELGWHWVFLGNVPILLGVAIVAGRALPKASPSAEKRSLDIAGSVLTVAGIGLLLLGTVKSIDWGWGDERTLALLGAGAVLMVLFVVVEVRGKDPLIPPEAFRVRNVGAGHLLVFFGIGASGGIVLSALYMQPVLGFSGLKTGLLLLPEAVAGVVASAVAAQSVRRFGPKYTAPIGLVLAGGAMLWLAERLTATGGGYGTVAVPLVLLGAAVAWCVVTGTMVASEAFARDDASLSSGTINAFGHVGATVMIAVMFTTMFSWFYSHLPPALRGAEDSATSMPEGAGAMPPFIAGPWVDGQIRALQVGGVIMLVAAAVVFVWLTNRSTSRVPLSSCDRVEASRHSEISLAP